MGLIAQIGARLGRWLQTKGTERRETDITPLIDFFGGKPTASGIKVSPTESLAASAVYNAIEMLSNDVAGLPYGVYRRVDGGSEPLRQHAADSIVRYKPNPEMTAFSFWGTVMGHRLGWGNSFSEIVRDGGGNPVELWPLPPNRMRIARDAATKKLIYVYRDKVGNELPILARNMLHIAGLGFDGILGYSVITKARESMGLTLAAQEYGATFFGNSAMPSGVLQHPETLSEEAQERLRKGWKKHYGGKKAHSVAILEEGMEWKPMTMSAKDSQFLETRKFQVNEIARWFNVPPHKIKDLSRATFSNIEQQSIDYVTTSLMPHLTAIEQVCRLKLLRESEQPELFFKHVVQALLRGDVKTRYEVYAIGVKNGIMNRDEIRRLEDLPPNDDPALKLFTVDGNVQALSMDMLNPPEPEPPPPEPDGDNDEGDDDEDERAAALEAIRHAHRPLFADAIGRLLRKEAKAARAAAKKPKEFNDWIEAYYVRHAQCCVQALEPVALVYGTMLRSACGTALPPVNAVDTTLSKIGTENFVTAMTTASATALNDVSGRCVPDALAGEVNSLVLPWQGEGELRDSLTNKLMASIEACLYPEPVGV